MDEGQKIISLIKEEMIRASFFASLCLLFLLLGTFRIQCRMKICVTNMLENAID